MYPGLNMFVTHNLFLCLLWNPFFQYLKGSELYSDSLSLTEYPSNLDESEVYLFTGARYGESFDSMYFIGHDLDSLNTDVENDLITREVSPLNFLSSSISAESGPSLVFNEHEPTVVREIKIRKRLKEIFQIQFPRLEFSLRHYFIENWPRMLIY